MDLVMKKNAFHIIYANANNDIIGNDENNKRHAKTLLARASCRVPDFYY